MPLRTISPLGQIQERVESELRGLVRSPTRASSALGGAAPASLGLAAPHPVFNLGLDAVDSPRWLEQAEMTAWRYFITSTKEGVIAAAEAISPSVSGPIKGTWTNEGPFVLGSEQALALSEGLPEVAAGNFVLGLLRVPALYVVALWLRSEQRSDDKDWFVPVDPAPKPLRANVLTRPADFVKALRKLKDLKTAPGAGDSESN